MTILYLNIYLFSYLFEFKELISSAAKMLYIEIVDQK